MDVVQSYTRCAVFADTLLRTQYVYMVLITIMYCCRFASANVAVWSLNILKKT